MSTIPSTPAQAEGLRKAFVQIDFAPEYPEILAQVANIIYVKVTEQTSLPDTMARELAMTAAEQIRIDLGGAMLYFPRGQVYVLSKRDEQIYAQWTGHNFKELGTRWGLSEMQVRNIVKRGQASERAKRQKKLF